MTSAQHLLALAENEAEITRQPFTTTEEAIERAYHVGRWLAFEEAAQLLDPVGTPTNTEGPA